MALPKGALQQAVEAARSQTDAMEEYASPGFICGYEAGIVALAFELARVLDGDGRIDV